MMPTATHNRLRPGEQRTARAMLFAAALLSLPTTVARAVYGACAAAFDVMAHIATSNKLCRARARRNDR